jgi:hypothetical protein
MAVEKYGIPLALDVAPADRHRAKAIIPVLRELSDGGDRMQTCGISTHVTRGLPQVPGSCGYRHRWAWTVGGPEFLSKGRTASAIIDSATNLKQQVGATSRPPHLLTFVPTAVHQEIDRPLGNRGANSQSGTVPLGVSDQPVALAGKITIQRVQRSPQLS